jgi:pantoate kinase
VLELGVTATARFRPSAIPRVVVRSADGGALPISLDVARRVASGAAGRVDVELTHDLPIGQGLGTSAAGALATGLAVSAVLGRPRRRAIETAHLAELFGGGGLGGVAAILGGGLEVRERPGIPPFGRVRRRPFPAPVILSVVGPPVPSPPLLRDPHFLDRVRDSAGSAVDRLAGRATPARFLRESERFTDAMALGSRRLRRTIRALRDTGAPCAQAMLGETLFAVPTSAGTRHDVLRVLERRRLPAVELRTATTGARLQFSA